LRFATNAIARASERGRVSPSHNKRALCGRYEDESEAPVSARRRGIAGLRRAHQAEHRSTARQTSPPALLLAPEVVDHLSVSLYVGSEHEDLETVATRFERPCRPRAHPYSVERGQVHQLVIKLDTS
jgi:hypothetical protein